MPRSRCGSGSKEEISNGEQGHAAVRPDVSKRWIINRKLLPVKIFYFFFYGACGTVIPFIPVYLKYLKLTASEIGLITGIAVLLCIFSRPAIGLVADKLNMRKHALIFTCMVFGCAFFLLWFIPGRMLASVTTNGTDSGDFLWTCPHNFTANNRSCRFHVENYSGCLKTQETTVRQRRHQTSHNSASEATVDNSLYSLEKTEMPLFCYYIVQPAHTHSNTSSRFALNSLREFMDYSRQRESTADAVSSHDCVWNCSKLSTSFISKIGNDVIITWPMKLSHKEQTSHVTLDIAFAVSFALLLLSRAFYASSTSLADAVTYTILASDRLKWGEQRLWGTVGTSFAVIIVTTLNDNLKGTNYAALFCLCLLWTCLACVVGTVKLRCDSVPKSSQFFQNIFSVLRSAAVAFYFLKLMFFGMLCGSAQNFFLWFIDDIGGSQINLGIVMLVYCSSSVIILRFTKRILSFMGQQRAMQLVLFCYAGRYLAYSFVPSPWLALPIEVLHGVTYSMFWAAASSTASLVAPPGTQATCQGLAGAIYWDLGRGLGTVVTGQLIQFHGARWTFRYYSIACAAALPVCCVFDYKWSLKQTLKLRKDVDPTVTKDVDLPKDVEDTTDVTEDKTGEVSNASYRLVDDQMDKTCDSKDLDFRQYPPLENHPANGDSELDIHCEERHSNHQCSTSAERKDNSGNCDNQHLPYLDKTCSISEGSPTAGVTTPLLGLEDEDCGYSVGQTRHAGISSINSHPNDFDKIMSVIPEIPAAPEYSTKQDSDSNQCNHVDVTLPNNTGRETTNNGDDHQQEQEKQCRENEGILGEIIERHGFDKESPRNSETDKFQSRASAATMDNMPERKNGGMGIRITIFPN